MDAQRGERAARRYTEHKRTYGVLTVKALTVDTTTERTAATENNFIAALYDEGVGRVGEGGKKRNLRREHRHAQYLF